MKKRNLFVALAFLFFTFSFVWNVWPTTYTFNGTGGAPNGPINLPQWMGGAAAFLNNGTAASFGYPLGTLKTPTVVIPVDNAAFGTGPAFNTTGDGHYLGSADASCGTVGKCFSSARGGFTGRTSTTIINIESLGATIVNGPGGNTAGVIKPFVTTIASVSNDNLITLTAAPTVTANTTGLAWFAGRDNQSAFQTAVTGSTSVQIPAGIYLQSAQLTIGSNTTIQCAPGTIILHSLLPTDGAAHNDLWRISSGDNNVTIYGCTFLGTNWRKAENPANFPGSDLATNNIFDYDIGINQGGTPTNNITIIGCTFKWTWAQGFIEPFSNAANSTTTNMTVMYNWFQDSALYGYVGDNTQSELIAFNYDEDARMGSELDVPCTNEIARLNVYVGNYIKYITGSGYENSGATPGIYSLIVDGIICTRTAPTDGVTTNGSSVVTSATAAFSLSDEGRSITGTNIPANTFIGRAMDSTHASLVNASNTPTATAVNATGSGSGITFTIGNYNYTSNRAYNNTVVGNGTSGSARINSINTCGTTSATYTNNTLLNGATQNCGS